jgi:hypothetical protein
VPPRAGALDGQSPDDYPAPVAPQQFVNAGDSSGGGAANPDMIGIGGEATDGHSLWFCTSTSQPGSFDGP